MKAATKSRALRAIPFSLIVALFCPFANGKVIHVDDDGQADFDNIQAGIDAAVDGDTVLVAPGEYVITEPITFRGKTITVRSEAGRDQTTIWMGAPANADRGSVVAFENNETSASVLEGFTFTGGTGCRRSDPYGNRWSGFVGGGILCWQASPSIIACRMTQNSANHGGGILCLNSDPILTDCIIVENSSEYGGGGGVNAASLSSPTLIHCAISGNSASVNGGGVSSWDSSSVALNNCFIGENKAGDSGGGVFCVANSSATINNCIIRDNSANGTAVMTGAGGGIQCWDNSSTTLTYCAIVSNMARSGGGMLCGDNSFATMTHCAIIGNTARGGAGGIETWGHSSAIVGNCVFVRNTAVTVGGGMDCSLQGGAATVTNSIFWENTAPRGSEIFVNSGGSLDITYSNVSGSQARVSVAGGGRLNWGEGNIDADPCFADPNNEDYHLKSEVGRWDPNSQTWIQDDVTSSCIDAGDPNSPLAFEPYPNGGIINMGAFGGTPEASKSPSGLHAKYGGGTGEPNDPYLIYTAEHLNALGAEPNDYDKHFKLMADIDLSGYLYDRAVIAPDMNDVEAGFQGTPFTGAFDGNGLVISHLTIAGDSYLGLFGQVEFGAIVSNLGLEEIDVNGTGDLVGGLVGYHSGSIVTTYSTGTVIGEEYVGGLVGKSSCIVDKGRMYCGIIESCYSCVDVSGAHCVGGLVGDNWHTISNCYATGRVVASGNQFLQRLGGLVGANWNVISNCYATGSVPSPYPYWTPGVGGLVGESNNNGKVMNSFWDTQTSGQTDSSGGTPKTTAEMQTANTFLEAGWDFADELANGNAEIWWILEGQDYPRLWWERPYEPPPEPQTDETTILGTWSWDVESDTLGGSANADFRWSHANSTNRYLSTMNEAKAAIVIERSFADVDLAFVNRLILHSRQSFSGSDVGSVLTPGTIIAFQTAEGNKGKLRVEGYRALHDFSFPEASYLSEGWKSQALTEPNREKYHLHVKWCLF